MLNTGYVRFTLWFNPLSDSVSHLRKSSEGFTVVSSFLTAEVTILTGAGGRGDGPVPFAGGLGAKEGVEGEETTTAGRTRWEMAEVFPLAPTVAQATLGITVGALRSMSVGTR